MKTTRINDYLINVLLNANQTLLQSKCLPLRHSAEFFYNIVFLAILPPIKSDPASEQRLPLKQFHSVRMKLPTMSLELCSTTSAEIAKKSDICNFSDTKTISILSYSHNKLYEFSFGKLGEEVLIRSEDNMYLQKM